RVEIRNKSRDETQNSNCQESEANQEGGRLHEGTHAAWAGAEPAPFLRVDSALTSVFERSQFLVRPNVPLFFSPSTHRDHPLVRATTHDWPPDDGMPSG